MGLANPIAKRNDEPAEIRTPELRSVDPHSEVFEAFPVGDITVRKAIDPYGLIDSHRKPNKF